jgi:hypothetical protein
VLTSWRVILWMFLHNFVDDSCSRVPSCLMTWLVSVLSTSDGLFLVFYVNALSNW